MNRGYVKLWRKAFDNGWLQNHALWTFWCYCLLRANHNETIVKIDYQEVPLKPGQFIFGRKRAARDLNMTEWKIRSCLYFLKKAEVEARKRAEEEARIRAEEEARKRALMIRAIQEAVEARRVAEEARLEAEAARRAAKSRSGRMRIGIDLHTGKGVPIYIPPD